MVISPAETRPTATERAYSGSRVAWGAILAGTVVALAAFAILSLIGLAYGFTLVEPTEADPMNGALTTAAIWQIASQIVALGLGGYVAANLAGLLPRGAALLHGVVVWAVATLAAIWIATSAVGMLVSGASSVVTNTVSGMGSAARAVVPDDFSLPDSISQISLDDLPEPVRNALEERGITPENFSEETGEAFRAIVSPQEQQQIGQQAGQTAEAIIANPADAGQEAQQFIDDVFGDGAVLNDQDRQQAIAQMQQRFGISEAEATRFLDETQARAEELKAEAQQAVDEVKAKALEAADAAADAAATAAWAAALAAIVGLIAALGGAALGRVGHVTRD